MPSAELGRRHRLGLIAFIVLTVLNGVEFWIAVSFQTGIMVPLAVLALIDAGLIAYYFMHVAQLWRPEEE